MALQTIKEAIRFSIVPESPERIAKHTWLPGIDTALRTNPAIMRVLDNAGLKSVEYFEIGKTLRNNEGRVRIAGEKAGAITLSEATGEQPILVFQQNRWSYEPSNYFFVPSQHDSLPIDRFDTYQNMLKRVVSEAAFNYVHDITPAVEFPTSEPQ
jgi:hypothetical protein